MLRYGGALVGARDRKTADRQAGSGAVRTSRGSRCAWCLGKAHGLGKAWPGMVCGAYTDAARHLHARHSAHDVAARSAVGSKSFHSAPV
jgi:hypothetical protein